MNDFTSEDNANVSSNLMVVNKFIPAQAQADMAKITI